MLFRLAAGLPMTREGQIVKLDRSVRVKNGARTRTLCQLGLPMEPRWMPVGTTLLTSRATVGECRLSRRASGD